MKRLSMLAAISFFTVTYALAQTPPEHEPRIAAARKAIASFATELQGALMVAIKADGTASAISVCSAIAPALADNASEANGWIVRRTSLKVRNPANKADDWETMVLHEFAKRQAAGEPLQTMERSEIAAHDGKPAFRYMKAIPIQQPCLACHGAAVAPDIKSALSPFYPDDQATGYALGDVRGAFSIIQPLD